MPLVSYPDIVNYLLFAPSPYTAEELKCYKAMEAYNFFICGFVKEIGVKVYGNICLVLGRVLHSQKLSERPPTPWVIADVGGKIFYLLTAHAWLALVKHVLMLAQFFSIWRQQRR